MKPNLRQDLLASIVVFLVALPLSMGIALASGAPVIAGLIAAACGGILVGLFGGAPLQVSGPAAGLTILVAGIVAKFGWPTTCLIALIAGGIQLALGFLKIARAALAITPAVVHGMLAGIGLTIAIAQFCVVLGAAKPPSAAALGNLQAIPGLIAGLQMPSILLGGLALAILFLWPTLPKKVQAVPGPLVAVVVPTIISIIGNFEMVRVNLPDKLTEGFVFPSLPSDSSLWGGILVAAATIALVASVESLLSAVATDKMHDGPRANLDKELVGQGVANMVSGALGGLPVTGVIVRSSANIRSGATTNRSAILHGVWIILFVALFSPYIERIPLAVLAGLLVHVGIRLVNMHHIKDLAKHRELPVYAVTALGVTFFGLLTGVGVGLALSFIILLRRMSHANVRMNRVDGRCQVVVDGALTFLTVPKLMQVLSQVPRGCNADIDLHVDFMDHAAFEALHDWEQGHIRGGDKVNIVEHREGWFEERRGDSPMIRKAPFDLDLPTSEPQKAEAAH